MIGRITPGLRFPMTVVYAFAFFLCFVAGAVASDSPGALWTEGFENGIGTAKPYHQTGPKAALEIISGDAPEGSHFACATLPGERALEGFSVTAGELEGGRLAQVTASVRGKGALWLCLHSSNGWLYSPTQVALTESWQTIRLDKALRRQDRSLGVFFISKTAQPGAVFEVDAIRVEMIAPPQVYDTSVEARRLEAEQFAVHGECTAGAGLLAGETVVAHSTYVALKGLPFPRTSRAVTVAVHLRLGAERGELHLTTHLGGNRQSLSTVTIETPNEWTWVRFPPVFAGEVGDEFGLELRCKGRSIEPSALDAVVLGTEIDESPEQFGSGQEIFAGFPMLAVLHCETPPEVDGHGDDACWSTTVVCTPFGLPGGGAPPEGPTTARLCYDDENLYALFECEEPILDVRGQRTHEFKAKAANHDQGVSSDDCCMLLLDCAQNTGEAFDIFANALGTIEDARCKAPNLWASRDTAWNSGARASGNIGDGNYTIEVSIPFAALTGKTPVEGEMWHAALGRVAKVRKEVSAWNPFVAGLHQPEPWGTLVFSSTGPGVTLEPPESLSPGRNILEARVVPGASGSAYGVYLFSRVRANGTWVSAHQFADATDGPADAIHAFNVPGEGKVRVAYGALDAATLQPLCMTPISEPSIQSGTAVVRLACEGPYELYVNDGLVKQGQAANGEELAVPLRKGVNVFALKLEEGTAAISLDPPGWQPDKPLRWKLAPPDAANPTLAAADDSAWQTAEPIGEHSSLGAIIGKPGGSAVLRHTLLWEETRVWPAPVPALYVARGTAQHLNIMAEGLPGKAVRDWSVYLAVPMDFEVLGATGYYGTSIDSKPRWTCTQLGVQEIDGDQMRVARIAADRPVVERSGHSILRLFNVFVRLPEREQSAEEAETRFVFWGEGNGGAITETPRFVPVCALPSLKGRQPAQVVWQLWGSFFNTMDDPEMRKATLELLRDAGVNDLVSGDAWTSDHAPEYGIRNTACINFEPWSLGLGAYLEEHPEKRRIGIDGKADDAYVCMTALLNEAWGAVAAKLQQKIERDHPDTLDYDYEYPPFNRPHACFCERCLKAFRERAHMSDDVELTGEIIKKDFADEWVDFMAWRTSFLFRKLKDEIKQIAPETGFSVYSGYQSEDNPFKYGVDWRYVGELQACDVIGCGYGRPKDSIEATREVANGIPTVFGVLYHPYSTSETVPPIPFTKARLLRRVLDAAGGVLMYNRLPLDGRSWTAIAETSRLVAAFEDVFCRGTLATMPGFDDANVQLVSQGSVTLLCVMNLSREEDAWTLPLHGEQGVCTEFYSGTTVPAGETVECVLPPGETAVYIFTG